jgi:hypothetical protein
MESPWDMQMCITKLGYLTSPTIKANSFEVRWGQPEAGSKKIATIVFEPGIRHWSVQTNGRNAKFVSNLTAAHQALQTELGISSISGGTTIVSAPIMSSYQELLDFGFANLQLACPGILITEQSSTGKGINNSGMVTKPNASTQGDLSPSPRTMGSSPLRASRSTEKPSFANTSWPPSSIP